ncbi:MAG: M14-type cytosolic carboxypeptidase [Blastocatellia bacterium]
MSLLLLLFLFSIDVKFNFEGGSLAKVEKVSETHFRCAVKGETDKDGRNRQASWYYFRLDNAKKQTVTIELTDLPGEYNFQPNRGAITADTIPFFSEDEINWKTIPETSFDKDKPQLTIRLTPDSDQVWIAHIPPYTTARLRTLLEAVSEDKRVQVEAIGQTVWGRHIPLVTITDPEVPPDKKKVIWLMARQHSWESFTSFVTEGAIIHLLSRQARELRRDTIFKILPMSDLDGVARGGVRFNLNGYDLNRNWDVVNEELMPEIFYQRKAILDWLAAGKRIDLFLTLHNTETAEYLEGPPDPAGKFKDLTSRFFNALKTGTTFDPSRDPAPADAKFDPGRANVVQGLWRERQIPVFLMEQRIARGGKLGRIPTRQDRLEFGEALVRAMWEAVR